MGTATGTDFAAALVEAANMAYKAVIKPVEGTILTVSRMSARGAVQAARDGADIVAVLEEAISHGEHTLERTRMLPTLKEAGVVDAGGKGFVVFLQGFLSAVKGQAPAAVIGMADGQSHPQATDVARQQAGVSVTAGRRPRTSSSGNAPSSSSGRLDPDAMKAALLTAMAGGRRSS